MTSHPCGAAAALPSPTLKSPRGATTLSLGVAIFPDHASEAAAIIKAVDVAPYQAKRGGRNRVVMFEEKAGQITLQRS